MQLFSLRRLRQRSGLWVERLTEAVHQGGMGSTISLKMGTLQGINISPQNGILKMIFLFPRWDMLVPWRVYIYMYLYIYVCVIYVCHLYFHIFSSILVSLLPRMWRAFLLNNLAYNCMTFELYEVVSFVAKTCVLISCLWHTQLGCILSPLLRPERLCWKRWQILWVGWGLWGGLPPPQGTQPLHGKDLCGNEGLPSQSHFQNPAYQVIYIFRGVV